MGELILCRGSLTAKPYYIEEKALNVYSLEEMSYYIAHNVYLLDPSFMNQNLIRWIGEDLGEKKLSGELNELMLQGAPMHVFVGRILEASGYLTEPEIRKTMQEAQTFENKSEEESRKIRADHLLQSGRYADAMEAYENLLYDREKKLPEELLGDICHNLGVAEMRLFLFSEAEDHFRRAYEKNHRRVSLRALLEAYLTEGNQKGYEEAMKRYLVPPDVEEEVREAFSVESENPKIGEFRDRIDRAFSEDVTSEGQTVPESVKHILSEWKKDYIHTSSRV